MGTYIRQLITLILNYKKNPKALYSYAAFLLVLLIDLGMRHLGWFEMSEEFKADLTGWILPLVEMGILALATFFTRLVRTDEGLEK